METQKNIISGPPFEQKWTFESVGEYFMEKIRHNAQKRSTPADLISMETGEQLTHTEVLEKSQKLAISLGKLGLKLNDRIGICSENNLNFGIAVLSSIFLGTTICPLNPSYTKRELIHTLKISKPKSIFVSISCLTKIQEVVAELSWSPQLILLHQESTISDIPNLPDLISKITDSELKNFKLPEIDQNDHVLLIACSSGTTGLPKGVMLTDKNILTQLRLNDETPDGLLFTSCSNSLGMLPMFHAFGLFVLFLTFSSGVRLIVLSKFDPRIFLKAVTEYKIDSLNLVPSLMVFLAKDPIVDDYDLSCVNRISCGAAPLSREIEEAIERKFNIPFVRTGLGMTEVAFIEIITPTVRKVGSVGKLIRGVSAKVIPIDGDSKEALGPNRQGELCFKGDIIMKGYCGDEEATRAAIDEDGFLHTGDVGYYDEDGYFFMVDRIKELIKYNGFQVPPAELESILLTHPAIKDAAVVGLPDESAGERPLAFVVKQSGVEIEAEDIIEYVNGQVSSQKKLRGGVRFIEVIPKDRSGKILRRELRNLLRSNS